MLGLAFGKKVLQFGYKRAGIPGAIATGSAAAVGYVVVKRALKSNTGENSVDSAINADQLKSIISERGLSAVTNRDVLDSAIDEDELGTSVNIEDVQSETEERTENLDDVSDPDDGA